MLSTLHRNAVILEIMRLGIVMQPVAGNVQTEMVILSDWVEGRGWDGDRRRFAAGPRAAPVQSFCGNFLACAKLVLVA